MSSFMYPITGAPTNTGLQGFRTAVDKWMGLAKSCKYVAVITPPAVLMGDTSIPAEFQGQGGVFDDLSFLCETAELPSRGFTSTDLRYYGPQFKMPFQTMYEDLNLTFLCRNQMLERELFDTWMEKINPTSTFDFAYRDDYATTITIYHMSDVGYAPNAKYKIVYEKAYPILLTAQPMTWMDDNFLRLTITFTFLKWSREQSMNAVDPVAFAYKLAGSDVSYIQGSTLPINPYASGPTQPRTSPLPNGGGLPPGFAEQVQPNPMLP